MGLTPGTRFGPYEIVSALGAGGMGEVYKGRDTRLDRDVAIKILPEAFASDADRVARFQREAKTLAALNHPNIAQIYGLERAGSVHALAMELVVGEDLSQRIARAPVPSEEALPIAKQIADALEAAHEQGIIHRDLKPANLKVRSDGTVKVLDFGLAKAIDSPTSSPDVSQSPTITTPAMTQAGMILGTAAYMSPEQAKGRPADRRSDLWSFGCVLYEMLAGKRAFEGDDVADTLAHVLTKEPDWSALPPDTSSAIRRLLGRCLDRDRRRRLDSAAVARLEIESAEKGEAIPVPSLHVIRARPSPVPWVVAGLAMMAAAAAAMVAWAPWRRAPEPARLVFELQLPSYGPGNNSPSMFAISPDGTQVVARILESNVQKLLVRSLAQLEGVTLAHTEGANYPFWSPDGRAVGFFADGKLKTIDLKGAVAEPLTDSSAGYGGSWNQDGVILYSPDSTGPIYRVSASGGSGIPATEVDVGHGDTSHRFPRFLPDGHHFLYLATGSRSESGGIYMGTLGSKEAHRLVDAVNKPEFAPPNLLLYARASTVMAQPLDVALSKPLGMPFRIADPVGSNANAGSASFSVSNNGVLTYRAGYGGVARNLAWVDRSGKQESVVLSGAEYGNPRLSPDGRRVAVFKPDGGGDIWIAELDRGAAASRFTLDSASDNVPVWSPDSTRIAFVSNRDGGVYNIYQKGAGGTGPEELLLKTPRDKLLNDWSPDDRYLVYEETDPQTKTDLWILPLFGERKPARLIATPFNESEGTVSPDGHWIAYTSDESGNRQVYVRNFPAANRKWRVSSTRVGAHPRWDPGGKELFFDAGGNLTAVGVAGSESGSEFRPAVPERLFLGLLDVRPHNFDVTPGGRRFLALMNPVESTLTGTPVTVVVNWQSGLVVDR